MPMDYLHVSALREQLWELHIRLSSLSLTPTQLEALEHRTALIESELQKALNQ